MLLRTAPSLDRQLTAYGDVLRHLAELQIPFCLGGSLALAVYTGTSRATKDLDIYVKPDDKQAFIRAMHELGFADYYEHIPYDRGWIYRAFKEDFLVDIIWQMANRRGQVDHRWFVRGPQIDVGGQSVTVMPLEELIWTKLYVLQRDRCDWPDILNLIDCSLERIDWKYLFARVEDDAPLLSSVLRLYRWLNPALGVHVPDWAESTDAGDRQVAESGISRRRAALLDSRDWFNRAVRQGARQESGEECRSAR